MWTGIWEATRDVSPKIARLRLFRSRCLVAAAVLALAAGIAMLAVVTSVLGLAWRLLATLGAAGALACLAVVSITDCWTERVTAALADDLRMRLGPAIVCTVGWAQAGGSMNEISGIFKGCDDRTSPDALLVTIAQRPRLGAEAPPNAYVTMAAPASTLAGMPLLD